MEDGSGPTVAERQRSPIHAAHRRGPSPCRQVRAPHFFPMARTPRTRRPRTTPTSRTPKSGPGTEVDAQRIERCARLLAEKPGFRGWSGADEEIYRLGIEAAAREARRLPDPELEHDPAGTLGVASRFVFVFGPRGAARDDRALPSVLRSLFAEE